MFNSSHDKAEQYLHAARTILSYTKYITTALCITTAVSGSGTALLVQRLFKADNALYAIPVSWIVCYVIVITYNHVNTHI